MNHSKGVRRQVFHGGSRQAQVISVGVNANPRKHAKRLQRIQTGYNLKALRYKALKALPLELQTVDLKRDLYNLTGIDDQFETPKPALIRYETKAVDDTASRLMRFFNKHLKNSHPGLIETMRKQHQLYHDLTREIRDDQFPTPTPYSVVGDHVDDAGRIEAHALYKMQLDANTGYSDAQKAVLSKTEQSFTVKNKNTVVPQNDDDIAKFMLPKPEPIEPSLLKDTNVLNTELSKKVYDTLAHPIDYLDVYRALFRGEQPIMSLKLLHELNICDYATKHFTDEQFSALNTHRAILLTWKCMNSRDLDNNSVSILLRYIDRLKDQKTRPLIHHNPELMGQSWIVEAFNNRNNPAYSQEMIRSAKAADADLNRLKLFMYDAETVPRRLGVFLGLHYIKARNTLPADAIAPFFRALNYCRYPGQVNTFLNIIMTHTPSLVLPPEACHEAMRAAHSVKAYDTLGAHVNYLRHTHGLDSNTVVPLPRRPATLYIDALQHLADKEYGDIDLSLEGEPAGVVRDLMARGVVPNAFTQDIGFAFKRPKQGEAITSYNCNLIHFLLPRAAYTAVNYVLATLRNFSLESHQLIQKPVRLYLSNMAVLSEEYASRRLASDSPDDSATIEDLSKDLNGNPIALKPHGTMKDVEGLTIDADGLPRLDHMKSDINEELVALNKALDVCDVFQWANDESRSPISPYVAHLVEQAIPTVAYNPHIYDDVLDIIHMRSGIVPMGLRHPNKIDEHVGKHVCQFLDSLNIKYSRNDRQGYVEISPQEFQLYTLSDPKAERASWLAMYKASLEDKSLKEEGQHQNMYHLKVIKPVELTTRPDVAEDELLNRAKKANPELHSYLSQVFTNRNIAAIVSNKGNLRTDPHKIDSPLPSEITSPHIWKHVESTLPNYDYGNDRILERLTEMTGRPTQL